MRGPGIEAYICCSSVNLPSSVALLQMRMYKCTNPNQPDFSAGSALPTKSLGTRLVHTKLEVSSR